MTIQEKFERFHAERPEVLVYLVKQARLLRQRGCTHYSMKALYNIARWHFQVERLDGEDYKLDDRYHSRYARLIMQDHPEFTGMFNLRRLRTA